MWTTAITNLAGNAPPDLTPGLGALGVGGAVAGLIFWFYVKREKEIVTTLTQFTKSFQTTIERNATAMAELTTTVRGLMDVLRKYGRGGCDERDQEPEPGPSGGLDA